MNFAVLCVYFASFAVKKSQTAKSAKGAQRFAKALWIVALILCVSSFSLAQSVDKKKTGSISGRVTLKGKGLAQARVRVSRQPEPSPEDGPGVTTDSEGHYQITSLPAGSYYVTASAPGFVPIQTASENASPRPVTLSTGEAVKHVDFQMVAGGVITGRVTDDQGRPLIEEPVILLEVQPQPRSTLMFTNPSMNPFILGVFQTDDRGMYRIFGIPPGSYKVSVGSPFPAFNTVRGASAHRRTFHPNVTDVARARVIEVAEGAVVSDVDIKVGPPVQTYTARGRVIDNETGEPLSNVKLDLRIHTNAAGASGGRMGEAVTSNNSGEFILERLPADRYSVKTSHHALLSSSYFGETAIFEIRDVDLENIELRASKTATISGMVVVENTRDKSVLARVGKIPFLVLSLPKERGPVASRVATPNSDGTFTVSGLTPGKIQMYPNGEVPAASGLRFKGLELDGVEPGKDIELKPGENITNLRVILTYGTGSVRGEVKLENGSLPDGARVHAYVARDKTYVAGTWADSRGHFLIEAVPAGDYTLIVSAQIPGKQTLDAKSEQLLTVADNQSSNVSISLDLTRISAPARQ